MNVTEARRTLPQGWRRVRLGEVCSVHPGQHILESDYNRSGKGVGYLTGPADFGEKSPLITKWTEKPKAWCERGDVLVTVKGAGVGKSNLAPGEKVAIGRQLMAIRPEPGVLDQIFLHFLIVYQLFKLRSEALGSTVPGLSRENIESLTVLKPPLREQQRIAALLNEQMDAIEKARAAAQVQLEAAKALPAAYLRAVFNSPEAQKWPKKRLGEVGEIVSGITLGRKLPRGATTRHIPYLRVANVKDGHLDLSDVYEIEATEAEIEKLRLKAWDILLTEGGDPDKVGRGNFWFAHYPECIHQNHIFRIRFDLNYFSPLFISYQIASPYGKSYFLAHAKKTTGIATINKKVLAGFPLMLPPTRIQKTIAMVLWEKIIKADSLKRSLEKQLRISEKLPAALLRRAFNGEL